MSLWASFIDLFRRDDGFRLRILFVCRANITRSPFLEHLFRKRLHERYPEVSNQIGIGSAGVEGFRRAAADPVMRYIASQREVDLLPHASQAVSHRLIEQADWVFTLEEGFTRQLLGRFRGSEGKIFPLPMFGTSDLNREDWDVTDPTGKEAPEYEAFAELAEQQVERLLDLMEGELLGTRTNLVLIGLPGSGKSTVGKAVAEQLEWGFLDTDGLIEEHVETSLQSVVDTKGYQELRMIEEEVLCSVDCTRTIIATGGSAVYSEKAMIHLRNLGRIIWLEVTPDEVLQRIGNGKERGLAKPPEQTLSELIEERNLLYPRWAERFVRTDDPDIDPVEQVVLSAGDVDEVSPPSVENEDAV